MADIVIALPRRPRDAELLHLDIAGLSKYDMPEFILPLSEMPLTASGKLLKRELRTRYA